MLICRNAEGVHGKKKVGNPCSKHMDSWHCSLRNMLLTLTTLNQLQRNAKHGSITVFTISTFNNTTSKLQFVMDTTYENHFYFVLEFQRKSNVYND